MTASVEVLLRRHASKLLVIDTNLLLLLTVGIADRKRIQRFKRTSEFSEADFDTVSEVAQYFVRRSGLLTTPHVLSETSNLVGRNPDLRYVLAAFVSRAQEVWIRARSLVARPEFLAMGLAAVGMLELAPDLNCVFTTDFELSGQLDSSGGSVLNYNHLRFEV